MLSFAVAATLLLSQPDPSGDHNGDGGYHLPENLSVSEAGSLDLRSFNALDDGGKLAFEVGLGALANPMNAPAGFSTPVIDIFIKTRVGGSTTLGQTGFLTPGNMGWQYHLHLSGFEKAFYRVPKNTPEKLSADDVQVKASGTTLHISTPIAAGKYEYWVTVSLFDPLTPNGLVSPSNDSNPYHLTSKLGDPPAPVDVLAPGSQTQAYLQRTLSPVGDLQDVRPWILLGMGILGVIGTVVGTLVLMRSAPTSRTPGSRKDDTITIWSE